jgi:inner membrane protein
VSQHLPFHISFIKFSDYLEDRWGHRTITHSLFFYLMLSLCLWPFIHFFPYLKTPSTALISALFLHTLLDTQNISGVYFWYPFNIVAVFPAVKEQRFRSGGFRDHLYLWHFLILLVPVLITTKIGCVRTIHLAAKQPWCVVQDYLVMSDNHRVIIQVPDAREVQTNRYISGNLLAVGTPDTLSLIVEDKDHYKYLIGQAPWATLAVRGLVAQEGIPVITRTERMKIENKPMSDLVSILKSKGDECRVSGYMRLAYQSKHLPLPNYPSIKTEGHFFHFVLADIFDIKRFGLGDSWIISADIKLKIVEYQSEDFKYQIVRVERGEDL